MKRSALALSLVLACFCCFAQEAPNPFTSQTAKPRVGILATATSGASALFFKVLAPVQRRLNESMAKMTLALEGSKSVGGLLLVIALSLAYGIFHAAGPGHGKTVVSSFLLANESKIIHSFIIGYLVAAVHALSALTVVGVLYYLIRGIFATGVERTNRYIQLVTFAVIAAIGAVMLVRRVAGREHHHHGPSAESLPARRLTTRSLLGIAVPAGIILCPGAVAVILFALSLHMLAVSILAICSISLGMGTTIGLTGAAVVLVKRGAIRVFAGAQKERDSKIRKIVEISGAAVLFLFGLILFLAQL